MIKRKSYFQFSKFNQPKKMSEMESAESIPDIRYLETNFEKLKHFVLKNIKSPEFVLVCEECRYVNGDKIYSFDCKKHSFIKFYDNCIFCGGDHTLKGFGPLGKNPFAHQICYVMMFKAYKDDKENFIKEIRELIEKENETIKDSPIFEYPTSELSNKIQKIENCNTISKESSGNDIVKWFQTIPNVSQDYSAIFKIHMAIMKYKDLKLYDEEFLKDLGITCLEDRKLIVKAIQDLYKLK